MPTAKKEYCEHRVECRKFIQTILDGEATPEQIAYFQSEMYAKCGPCESMYSLEKCIKEALQLRAEKKSVPCSLLDCIKQKIASI